MSGTKKDAAPVAWFGRLRERANQAVTRVSERLDAYFARVRAWVRRPEAPG